jgi:subtilisin-like proprotein convertase family protein
LLEEIVVTLNITHTYRGDLTAFLTDPAGTYTSRLFIASGSDSTANLSWSFTDNAFWGEQAQGTWTLQVVDTANIDVGTWNSFDITFRMGTIVPIAVPEPVTIAFLGFATLGSLGALWHRRKKQRQLLNQIIEPTEAVE